VNVLAIGVVTQPLAALSWQFFEHPINELEQKFSYRASTTDRGEACPLDRCFADGRTLKRGQMLPATAVRPRSP
jgi:peptidoglycan/LPS O-acetylase OafA/YrhL